MQVGQYWIQHEKNYCIGNISGHELFILFLKYLYRNMFNISRNETI